jgi:hypothetical protein
LAQKKQNQEHVSQAYFEISEGLAWSISTATGYRLDGLGSISGRVKEIFLCFTASRLALQPIKPHMHEAYH